MLRPGKVRHRSRHANGERRLGRSSLGQRSASNKTKIAAHAAASYQRLNLSSGRWWSPTCRAPKIAFSLKGRPNALREASAPRPSESSFIFFSAALAVGRRCGCLKQSAKPQRRRPPPCRVRRDRVAEFAPRRLGPEKIGVVVGRPAWPSRW